MNCQSSFLSPILLLPSVSHSVARELPPFHLVRLAPEEFLRDDEKALREKAGEEAHKRMSLSVEEVQVRIDGGSSGS